jgi:putative transcriptional regulator
MPTRKRSDAPSKPSNKHSKRSGGKLSPLGASIVRGLAEAAAHRRGELQLRSRVIQVFEAADIRNIREQTGLSQSQFADRFGFNPRTLQEWEQGRTKPDTAIRAYLTVIAKNPLAVANALGRD